MADNIDNQAFDSMTSAANDDIKLPKEENYTFAAYGRDTENTRFSLYTNPEDSTLVWKHPSNKLLYSSEGKKVGYTGIDDKFHFGTPKFDPLQELDDTGNIISERAIKSGSLEDVWTNSPDTSPISNKYFTAEEGQKYYGWGSPKRKYNVSKKRKK